jgi:hypothetical protein
MAPPDPKASKKGEQAKGKQAEQASKPNRQASRTGKQAEQTSKPDDERPQAPSAAVFAPGSG